MSCSSAPSVSNTFSRRCTPRWSNATAIFMRSASGHACPQRECPRDHVVDRVAELLEHRVSRRRGAEVLDRDRVAVVADPLPPAERHAGLYRDPCLHVRRYHLVAILRRLRLEELPARHRDEARAHTLLVELLCRSECELHLRARCDEDQVG